jgi:Peptidase family M3
LYAQLRAWLGITQTDQVQPVQPSHDCQVRHAIAVQFMENFCYERKTLFSFAKHHETGEPLPEDLYQKLCAARTFRAGSMMMRQVRPVTVRRAAVVRGHLAAVAAWCSATSRAYAPLG